MEKEDLAPAVIVSHETNQVVAKSSQSILSACFRERNVSSQLLLNFAASALHSSRSTTVANPLPVELDEARALMETFGDDLIDKLDSLSPASLSFLRFLLFPDGVSIRKIAVQKHWSALNLPARFVPDAIFEVEYGSAFHQADFPNALGRQKHAEFCKAEKLFPTQIAFHGTELSNLHNVLREGLKNDKKLAGRNGELFGKGIYLSEDIEVSMNFLSFGKGRAGAHLACMLECEVILDPSQVLRGSDELRGSNVPAKYIVVKNDCLVRPKRLLIYQQKAKVHDYRWLGSLIVSIIAVALLLLMFVKKNTLSVTRFLPFWE